MRDGLILIALVAALAAVLFLVPPVRGQSAVPGERILTALLARVSMNEGGPADGTPGDGYADLALIWQIVEGHGESQTARARWLASHSRCVAAQYAPRRRRMTQAQAALRPGQCRWTRNLHRDGRRPEGWSRALHGHWSRMRRPWLAHIPRVRAFVDGSDTHRPCVETPTTWDGRTWQAAAEARGFRAVACQGGARNLGYVRAASPDGA